MVRKPVLIERIAATAIVPSFAISFGRGSTDNLFLRTMRVRLGTMLFVAGVSLFGQQKPLRERLLESAQKGDAEAQFELGKNYETGRIGLPKDFVQAEHWYRLAAEQGDPFAEASLGLLYQFGKGVKKDPVQALMWYEVALARSSGGDRGSILELRDDIVSEMTAAQIADARRRAGAIIKVKP
jgi:hypothetical protein